MLRTVGVFILCFVGLAISNFPRLALPSLNLWEMAAAPASQIFLLIGVVFLLPMILAYTGYSSIEPSRASSSRAKATTEISAAKSANRSCALPVRDFLRAALQTKRLTRKPRRIISGRGAVRPGNILEREATGWPRHMVEPAKLRIHPETEKYGKFSASGFR